MGGTLKSILMPHYTSLFSLWFTEGETLDTTRG